MTKFTAFQDLFLTWGWSSLYGVDISFWFDFFTISDIIISCHLIMAHIFQIWLRRDVWSLAYNQVQLPMFKLLNIFFLLFMETKSSKEYSVAISVEKRKL